MSMSLLLVAHQPHGHIATVALLVKDDKGVTNAVAEADWAEPTLAVSVEAFVLKIETGTGGQVLVAGRCNSQEAPLRTSRVLDGSFLFQCL